MIQKRRDMHGIEILNAKYAALLTGKENTTSRYFLWKEDSKRIFEKRQRWQQEEIHRRSNQFQNF